MTSTFNLKSLMECFLHYYKSGNVEHFRRLMEVYKSPFPEFISFFLDHHEPVDYNTVRRRFPLLAVSTIYRYLKFMTEKQLLKRAKIKKNGQHKKLFHYYWNDDLEAKK